MQCEKMTQNVFLTCSCRLGKLEKFKFKMKKKWGLTNMQEKLENAIYHSNELLFDTKGAKGTKDPCAQIFAA